MLAAPRRAGQDILQEWCDSRAHFIEPKRLRDDRSGATAAADARQQSQVPSPEEVSQRSVDLLLLEYYKMVKSSSGNGSGGSGSPGLVDRAFLALACHPLPCFLGLGTLVRATAAGASAAARLLAALPWLFVPLWLAVVATLWQAGRGPCAAAAAVGGLAALLLADGAARAEAEAQAAAGAGAVTAANVGQLLPAGGAGAAARWFPPAGAQQRSNPGPSGSGGADGEYGPLLSGLEALQQLVFGGAGDSGVLAGAGPRERLASGLQRVAETAGFPLAPGMLDSTDGMAQAIAGLRRHLGCT